MDTETATTTHPAERKRTFLLLRSLLIVAAGSILAFEPNVERTSTVASGLIALALLSNGLLLFVSPATMFTTRVYGVVLVADTLWISCAFAVSGLASPDFFILYFFVLFLAAISERLMLMLVSAAAMSAGYVLLVASRETGGNLWTTPTLLRIPFIFTAAVFYGILVEQVRAARRRAQTLEIANRVRTDLLATVTHDIRNSVHVISSLVYILSDRYRAPLDEAGREILDRVRISATCLAALVSNFLDFARIRAGHVSLRREPRDLNELVAETAAQHEVEVKHKGLQLHLLPDSHLPPVPVDPVAMARVIGNLLSNAIRYTPSGGTIEIRSAQRDDTVELAISDTGKGIPREELPSLFQPYGRERRTSADVGVGLGLFIVKSLVELHQGSVRVETSEGQGSTFTVSLPLGRESGLARPCRSVLEPDALAPHAQTSASESRT